jgi:hypothetical protein
VRRTVAREERGVLLALAMEWEVRSRGAFRRIAAIFRMVVRSELEVGGGCVPCHFRFRPHFCFLKDVDVRRRGLLLPLCFASGKL